MKASGPDFVPTEGKDVRAAPVRLLVVQGEARPPVDATDEHVRRSEHMLRRHFRVPRPAGEILRIDDRFLRLDRKFVEIHGFAHYECTALKSR